VAKKKVQFKRKKKTSYVSKKSKKKKKKKKRKYKVSKKLEMEDIYRIINRVQIGGQKASFSVAHDYAAIVENVLADANLFFEKNDLVRKVTFCVFPPEELHEDEEIIFDLDFVEDEILEEGKLF